MLAGENPPVDTLRAAARLVGNREAVARFAARGCGRPGRRPVSAPLADPTAEPGEEYLPAVDAGAHMGLLWFQFLDKSGDPRSPVPSVTLPYPTQCFHIAVCTGVSHAGDP